ncbi:HAD family hydrolase [Streptomyces tauricus]|uniref:HAD family hydrolase n=1 Tax=Streptomyces tauricus TaxID=68274 RepID=UPI003448A000
MPLLMLDLDNTLVDRDAAFREAASAFLAGHRLPVDDLAWLMSVDGSGYTPRDEVGRAMAARYGRAVPAASVRDFLDRGAADRVVLAEAVRAALVGAVDAGWTCVIVTNGRVGQQETKIRRTGLDRIVHGWVISEAAGCRKPAPEIFRAAAAVAGPSLDGPSRDGVFRNGTPLDGTSPDEASPNGAWLNATSPAEAPLDGPSRDGTSPEQASLHGAWLIGDSPHADIGGASALDGVRSVWVSAGRPWTDTTYRPTHITADTASALTYVVEHPGDTTGHY